MPHLEFDEDALADLDGIYDDPLTRPAADLSPWGEVETTGPPRTARRYQLLIALAPAGRGMG
ncbi:MAG: hypothetical protein ACHRXM_02510 [Isosphaerales bacterium]